MMNLRGIMGGTAWSEKKGLIGVATRGGGWMFQLWDVITCARLVTCNRFFLHKHDTV
jgi:hypothetical protein